MPVEKYRFSDTSGLWNRIYGPSDGAATQPPGNYPPIADFTFTASNLVVNFNGSSSTDPDGSVSTWAWDFGDGTNATGMTPSKTYSTAGTRTVSLTVTDNRGGTDSLSRTVTVSGTVTNQPPTASFTVSASGLTASVNSTASADADGTIASRTWNWGDGTANSTGITASHTYSTSGTKTITLTVVDNLGASTTTTRTVAVSSGTDNFVLGTTKPNASNTGTGFTRDAAGNVITTAKPTNVYNGNMTVSTSNTLIENRVITGRLIVNSGVSNVTVRNCEIQGGTITSGDGTAVVQNNGTNLVLEFCEIYCSTGWQGSNGVANKKYTARRCDLHHSVDPFRINNPNARGTAVDVVIEGCYVHDLIMWTPDLAHSGRTDNKTHADAIEIEDGLNIRMVGNTMLGFRSNDQYSNVLRTTASQPFTPVSSGGIEYHYSTAAVIIALYTGGVVSNLVIDRNWFDGGEVTINGAHYASGSLTNNRFGRDCLQDPTVIWNTTGGLARSGNVYEGTTTIVRGG